MTIRDLVYCNNCGAVFVKDRVAEMAPDHCLDATVGCLACGSAKYETVWVECEEQS